MPVVERQETDAQPLSIASGERKRPGCITVYAILLGGGPSLALVLSIVINGLSRLKSDVPSVVSFSPRVALSALSLVAMAIIGFLIARGLWGLKKWSRYAILALQTLSIVQGARMILIAFDYGNPFALVSGVVGILLSGGIALWFATHGRLFK
jgi:hypothetical protein